MRAYRLPTVSLTLAAAMLLATPAHAALVDCDEIRNLKGKQSYQAINSDLRQCINRGYSPPKDWIPDEGKGAGLTSGGAGGMSYGAVKAPESPPGTRNENASTSAGSIAQSCNFPPRIKLGVPPSVSFPTGSCLDFMNDVFSDKSGATNTSAPVGIPPTESCPAETDSTGVYGVRTPAVGSVPIACGGIAPIASGAISMNANANLLATTTEGSYYIWTYRKSGASYAARLNSVQLPSFLCGLKDSRNRPIKTIDLTPPTEQMITYDPSQKSIAIKLQPRGTMPENYIPAYVDGEPEKYLILPLNAAGDPIVPANCAAESYLQSTTPRADILVKAAAIAGTPCPTVLPTMANYPACNIGNGQPPCSIGGVHDNWIAICNASVPAPIWTLRVLPDTSTGKCPGDVSASSGCISTPPSVDTNCDTVAITMSAISGACPGKVLMNTISKPGLFYPPGSTAKFDAISGRTQVMANAVAGSRLFLQNNTPITVQATAPAMTLPEGGSLIMKDGSILIMKADSTIVPGSAIVTFANGGTLTNGGGVQLAVFNAGGSYTIPGGGPYEIHVGRSITLPLGYSIPTIPALPDGTKPYVKGPMDTPAE